MNTRFRFAAVATTVLAVAALALGAAPATASDQRHFRPHIVTPTCANTFKISDFQPGGIMHLLHSVPAPRPTGPLGSPPPTGSSLAHVNAVIAASAAHATCYWAASGTTSPIKVITTVADLEPATANSLRSWYAQQGYVSSGAGQSPYFIDYTIRPTIESDSLYARGALIITTDVVGGVNTRQGALGQEANYDFSDLNPWFAPEP